MSALFRCASFVLTGLFLSASPVETVKTWRIEIEAPGEANPKCHGNEGWIYEVRSPQEVLTGGALVPCLVNGRPGGGPAMLRGRGQ